MPIGKKKKKHAREVNKSSDWAGQCSLIRSAPHSSGIIALSSKESAKRQKSKAKPKQPSSQQSSATPSTEKRRNPISLPISTINSSTPNPQ